MSAFDKAWAMVKDMTTATRSADLWVMNDEGLYFGVRKQIITPMVRAEYESDLTEEQVKDVDWLEVARNFDEDIDGIMDDFYFDRHGEALTE